MKHKILFFIKFKHRRIILDFLKYMLSMTADIFIIIKSLSAKKKLLLNEMKKYRLFAFFIFHVLLLNFINYLTIKVINLYVKYLSKI